MRTIIMMWVTMVVSLLILGVMPLHGGAIDIQKLRQMAAKNNVTCILVFGDSSVDPGNNNHLVTTHKSNFPPYGKDFFNSRPTGRFSNGKLVTDYVAEALGYTKIIRAFLDPHLEKEDLLHGVSFASGGSGFDNLTVQFSNVISLPQQLEYLKHYKGQLRKLVGEKEAEQIITNAIFVLSMGTNDFLQNYYVDPTRSQQFTMEQYQNYLISCMFRDIKAMHTLGARRLVMVGMEPFGCSPLVKTLKDTIECDATYNKVALSFNSKIKEKLAVIESSLGMSNAYIDTYRILQSILQAPKKYGFTETRKGCVGSGTIEFGVGCRGLSTCGDRTKYIYWDAVHLTEQVYKIIAEEAVESLIAKFG